MCKLLKKTIYSSEKMAESEVSQTFGISKETLKCVVSDKYSNKIAKRVHDAWESLATFIGIPHEDVHDIKEEYRKPLDRRLAMMRRWHELWGSEATYLRLVEGLRQIGRRDLIELLKQDTQLQPSASGSKPLLKHQDNYDLPWESAELECKGTNLIAILILFLGALFFSSNNNNITIHNIVSPNCSIDCADQQNLTKNITHHLKKEAFSHRIAENCSSPESDLPIIHPLFVGRENEVLLKVARAHIVNINGAPGFGKSTLAIHVGYEVVKNGTSVRYINVEEKLFSIVSHWQRSTGKTEHKFSNNDVHQVQTKSVIKHSRSSLSATNSQLPTSKTFSGNLFEELQRWSKEMKCTNVLILDNCDDILTSEYRRKFLSFIDALVMRSKFKLHVIIISQEKLLYLDDFDCWTVKELDPPESIEMLDKIAPAIDNETLRTAAELVEGCPLALKVIGQLLHIHGAKLIPKLKEEMITLLDEASIPKQRFRVIMDVAFERLGILKDCGYVLGLFPGSFDEQAGISIIKKECWLLYFKHSLLSVHSFPYNDRYKVHRLIKEYLQEKISIHENTTFIIKFGAYFESLMLTHAMSEEKEKSQIQKYSLSLELHNLYYLKELLLTDTHLSSKELAVLGLLSDIDLIQFEQLHRYYINYIENIHEVCPLLNNLKLCGKMYSIIVQHLYRKCKCDTIRAYFQNFFISPCKEYFQCKMTNYLHDLHSFGVMHLSQDELSYIDIILHFHCNEGSYHIERNHYISSNVFMLSVLILSLMIGPLVTLLCRNYCRRFCTGCTIVIIAIVLWIMCACISFAWFSYKKLNYTVAHYQFLRILEIISKEFCLYAIPFFALMFITSLMLSKIPVVSNYFIVILSIILILLFINPPLPYYCCQFIPLCV